VTVNEALRGGQIGSARRARDGVERHSSNSTRCRRFSQIVVDRIERPPVS
jgi:hypothetical protein